MPYRAGAAILSCYEMADVVELKPGESPPAYTRHALVIASPKPPRVPVPTVDRGLVRLFFATTSERDIAVMIRRAVVWADSRQVPNVYLRREG